jgi:hypothetical protein
VKLPIRQEVPPERGHESLQALLMRCYLIGGLAGRVDIGEIDDGEAHAWTHGGAGIGAGRPEDKPDECEDA